MAENNRQPAAVNLEDGEVQWRAAQVSRGAVTTLQTIINEDTLRLQEEMETDVARPRRKGFSLAAPKTTLKNLGEFMKEESGKEEEGWKDVHK